MTTERFDEHLLFRLPESYLPERTAGDDGKEVYKILCDVCGDENGEQKAALRVKVQDAGRDGEIKEEDRNLKGNFHVRVTANIHEVPALLWTVNALVIAVLVERERRPYVLACYETVRSRDELNDFAARAAKYLNTLLDVTEIDGEECRVEEITAEQLLELAGVAEPMDEETAQKEEQQRALEQFQRDNPEGGGMSVRAVYRDPITGKVKRDLFWERAGAESGDPEAMIKLALAYKNGDGVEQSDKEAADYMRKAAELDHPTAQFNMGIFYLQGCGVERDPEQARYWLEQARDNGDEDAEGILRSLEKLPALRERAKNGGAAAQVELAKELMTMRGEDNYREALELAHQAAEAGSLDALWVLALAYEHSRGVKQDYEEAFRLYKRAAEAGHAPSQANLACLYARGDGVGKDMQKAEEWVRKSAEQGDPDGIRLLRNIDPVRAMELEQAAWQAEYRRKMEEERNKRAAEWLKKYGKYVETNPKIVVNGSKFVFTGSSTIADREALTDALEKMKELGGEERAAVSGKTDYLVVDPGDAGESKINKALEQRGKGNSVKIVLLDDFLKALGMPKKENTVYAEPVSDDMGKYEAVDKTDEEQRRKAEEERRLEEERRQQEAELNKKREAEEKKAAYENAVAEYEQKKREIEQQRQSELAAALAEKREKLKAQYDSRLKGELEFAEKIITKNQDEKRQAEQKLNTLGFMLFGEKKAQKTRIQEAENSILAAEKQKERAEKEHREAMAGLESAVKSEEGSLRASIENRLPLPIRPNKFDYMSYQEAAAGMTPRQAENEAFKQDILAWMEPGVSYVLNDLLESVPSIVASGMSANRLSALLVQLADAGQIQKSYQRGTYCYSLV